MINMTINTTSNQQLIILVIVGSLIVASFIGFCWIMFKGVDVMTHLKELEKKAEEAKTIHDCDNVVIELRNVEVFHPHHYSVRDRILAIIKTKVEYINKYSNEKSNTES